MNSRIPGAIAAALLTTVTFSLAQPTSPSPGDSKWEASLDSHVMGGPTLGTNGLVYVVTSDGELHAWDAGTGNTRWQTNIGYLGIGGHLVVGPEGHLYIAAGTVLHARDGDTGQAIWSKDFGYAPLSVAVGPDSTVYALATFLHALDPATGNILWELHGEMGGVPALSANGLIFVGATGGVLGVDARTGRRLWEFARDNAGSTALAVAADGTVLAGDFLGRLFALDGATGEPLWNFQGEGEISGIIIAPDGAVCVGMYEGPSHVLDGATGEPQRQLTLPAGLRRGFAMTEDGTLYVTDGVRLNALNFVTGETNWVFEPARYGISDVNISSDGTVYFGLWNPQGGIYALQGSSPLANTPWPKGMQNAQNSSYWKVSGPPEITRQPRSHWAALDASTAFHFHSPVARPLHIQWRFNGQPIPGATNESLRIERVRFADTGNYSVAVSNQLGSAVSEEAMLSVGYALAVATLGPGIVQRVPELQVYPTNSVVELTAVPQTNRNFLGWSGDATGTVETLTMTLDRNYAVTATFQYLPGDVKWRPPIVDADAALSADGRILYGHQRYSYVAVDTTTRRKIWETGSNGEAYSPPAIGREGTVYIGSYGTTMNALDGYTGEWKWSFPVGVCVHACPAVGVDGTLYFAGTKLYAVDPATGMKKWSADGFAYDPAVSTDGVVCASVNGRMSAFHGVTGEKLWESAAGSDSSPAFGLDGTVYFGSWDGSIYALDGATGRKRWEFVTGGAIRSSPVIGPDGSVYIGSEDTKIYALHGQTGQKKWDFQASGPILSKSAALAADGTLYVGCNNAFDSHDGKLYALNTVTGEKLWEFDLADDVFGAPNIGPDGTVYFGSFALHGTSPLAASPWPKFQGHADNRGRARARPMLDRAQSRLTSEGFALTAHGEMGEALTAEWTVDWLNWTPLQTLMNTTGRVEFLDPTASASSQRFYRAHRAQ